MKRTGSFFLGLFSGILLCVLVVGGIYGYKHYKNDKSEIKFFETPGDVVSVETLRVVQPQGDDYALVQSMDLFGLDQQIFLLYDKGEMFYDNQFINVSKGKVFKEIGRFNYTTVNGDFKVVPIIQEMKK